MQQACLGASVMLGTLVVGQAYFAARKFISAVERMNASARLANATT